ncbi:MAG: T9SS type A sorting domain-containing protein [Bacteroidales bacterium]|jgi:hypothetical protein|nr:T9SS type A sorting domain-containing protein [Bacteroidales bacterium]
MKKLLMIVVAFFFGMSVFAQQPVEIQKVDNFVPQSLFKVNPNAKLFAPSFKNGKEDFVQSDANYAGYALSQSTDRASFGLYTDIRKRTWKASVPTSQVMSVAQIYDFKSQNKSDNQVGGPSYSFWESMLYGQDFPALTNENITYTIHSSYFLYGYFHKDSAVVDTIVISYILNLDQPNVSLSMSTTPVFKGFCPNANVDEGTFSSTGSQFANKQVYVQKIPIEAASNDMLISETNFKTSLDYSEFATPLDAEGYFYPAYFGIKAPAELENISSHIVGLSIGFLSGKPFTTDSLVFDDINRFVVMHMIENRPDNRAIEDATGLHVGMHMLDDYNTSLFVVNNNQLTNNPDFVSGLFKDKYCPTMIYDNTDLEQSAYGHLYGGMLVSCECGYIQDHYDGVKEHSSMNVTVSPNPATDQIKVKLDGTATANIQLFNLMGQEVMATQARGTESTLNVSNLNKGMYLLRVSQNNEVYTAKVLVK